MNFKWIDQSTGQNDLFTNERIAEFLFRHLDQYGDKKADILKCLDYVFNPARGGAVLVAYDDKEDIQGAVILNETGMKGYIPELILVYIAVHKDQRGKGLGKQLMQEVIHHTEGNIALHVEPDNPAARLYRKIGFTSKYLEMRYIREEK